jgi:hypothetical protein
MASTASTILRLEIMTPGEQDGTWGQKNNTNLQLLETAVAGRLGLSTTGGTTTLTNVDYTNDQAKKAILDIDGTLVSNATIVIPNASKTYKVLNRTSGSFTLAVKTASGSEIQVTQNTSCEVYCDGSDTVRFLTPMTTFGTGAPATASGAAASAVSVSPAGNLGSTNAQAAFSELQGDIDTINASLLSSYQPLDGDLTTLGGLAKSKGNLIVGDGSAWAAQSVGTDGFALIAKSGATNGVQWSALLPAGTVCVFYQAAAPTGWTVSDAHSDYALRMVSGASGLGGSVGGNTAFSVIFTNGRFASGTVDGTTLTISQIPSHDHVWGSSTFGAQSGGSAQLLDLPTSGTSGTKNGITQTRGGGASHDHTFVSNNMDFNVAYVNVIKAAKAAY